MGLCAPCLGLQEARRISYLGGRQSTETSTLLVPLLRDTGYGTLTRKLRPLPWLPYL